MMEKLSSLIARIENDSVALTIFFLKKLNFSSTKSFFFIFQKSSKKNFLPFIFALSDFNILFFLAIVTPESEQNVDYKRLGSFPW